MSDLNLILDLVKAYNLKVKNHIKAVKNKDNEAASRLSEGAFEDRKMIYDKLRDETCIALPDSTIIETLRSIRDGKGDHWLEFVKWAEGKNSEHFDSFKKEHQDIWEKFVLWPFDDTKENQLSNEEWEILSIHINATPSRHVPTEEDLSKEKHVNNVFINDERIGELLEMYDLSGHDKRSLEIEPILLVEKETKPSSGFFGEIRSCYSLCQYSASVVLCRAFLEEALKEFCRQVRPDASVGHKSKRCPKCKEILIEGKSYLLSSQEGEDKLWAYGLMKIVHDKELSLKLDKALKEKVLAVSEAAKEILHRGKGVGQEEALQHIRNTRSVIEELYA